MALNHIDPWHPPWWEQLCTLHAQRPRDHHVHLLVDSAFVPGLHRALPPGTAFVPLFRDGSDAVRDVSPLAIGLQAEQSDLRRVLARCDGAPALSAVITPEPLLAWAQRLQPWCVVQIDDDWFNCRFPDTRRLPGIWGALDRDQRAAFAGPATSWHHIGRDGAWQTLPQVLPTDAPPLPEVQLTPSQFQAILEDAAMDELLFRFFTQGRHQQLSHAQRHAHATAACQAARQQGLAEDRLFAWVDHWLTQLPHADAAHARADPALHNTLLAWMQATTL